MAVILCWRWSKSLQFQNPERWIAGTIGFEIVYYFMRLKVVTSPNIEGLVYNFCLQTGWFLSQNTRLKPVLEWRNLRYQNQKRWFDRKVGFKKRINSVPGSSKLAGNEQAFKDETLKKSMGQNYN